MLRNIFGSKKDEVRGMWRRVCNKEIHDLYCSPNIVWVINSRLRWAGHVARMKYRRSGYRNLVGNHRGKELNFKTRHRWEDNVKIDLQELDE